MAHLIQPLPRLKQLAAQHGHTPALLARVINRSDGYLRRRWDADTYLLDLPIREVHALARFYGVPAHELGG